MKRLLSAFILAVVAVLCGLSASAAGNAASVSYGSIAASDTAVSLKRYCRAVQIILDSGSADVYVELNNNTASVGGATCVHITGGTTWQSPANVNLGINGFHYIGATATGKMTIIGY